MITDALNRAENMTQLLIPLHRARNLQPGDEYVQDGHLYRVEKLGRITQEMTAISYEGTGLFREVAMQKATVTPLPDPKLTRPWKP